MANKVSHLTLSGSSTFDCRSRAFVATTAGLPHIGQGDAGIQSALLSQSIGLDPNVTQGFAQIFFEAHALGLIILRSRLAPNGSILMIAGSASESVDVLREVVRLAARGHFHPVIDRCFGYSQMVAAHAHVDTGHKTGNVVVTGTGQ